MNAEGTLETVAEIGISLVGFAGIVGALAGEKIRPGHPAIWIPFWSMISSGLGVVFIALFPFLPYHLGASDHVLWAASSALLIVVLCSNMAFFMPRVGRSQRAGVMPRTFGFDVPLRLSMLLTLVSQVLNTFGVGLQQSAGGFLIGLYLILLISGLNFVFLLYFLEHAPEPPPAV
jgi:hypothetical protein